MAELYLDLVGGAAWEEGAEAGVEPAAISSAQALLQQVGRPAAPRCRPLPAPCAPLLSLPARAPQPPAAPQVKQAEGGSLRHQVLECYATMAGRAKADVEAALSRLLDCAGQDPNAVPVLLALARGFLLLKQPPKAKNQLKRLAKLPYRPEDGEELEAGCLLLADMQVAAGKYDLAQQLCSRWAGVTSPGWWRCRGRAGEAAGWGGGGVPKC